MYRRSLNKGERRESMKRVFLMDYENTAVRGLYGISELGYGDKVVVFCSNENIQKALMDLLRIYEERRVEIRVHLLKKRAVNALDFMITTYLGFEVSVNEEKEIFVISADKGYESAIDMAHELSNGIFIGFHESIYQCLHESSMTPLPDKSDQLITIEAEDVMAIQADKRGTLSGKEYKALGGPVKETAEPVVEKKKPRGFTFGLKPVTRKQREQFRRGFMEKMEKDGTVPEPYISQLVAFMEKCHDRESFIERASTALGGRNVSYLDRVMAYFDEYQKERP